MFRHLKYWQKLYLSVLILFIVCLVGGFAVFAQYSVNNSFKAHKEAFLYTQHTVVEQLASDIPAVMERDPEAIRVLFQIYAKRLRTQGYQFMAEKTDGPSYGELPEITAALQPGQRGCQLLTDPKSGHHLLVAVTVLDEDLAGYRCGLGEDMEPFFQTWHDTIVRYLVLAAGLIVLFAIGLCIVLRRLNRPIRELEDKASHIAEGRYDGPAMKATVRQDELGDLARALEQMSGTVAQQIQELKEESEARQRLIDDLGHEMRTPLTAIRGFADLLQRSSADPEALYEGTEIIRKESDRLLKLSEQLMKLSVLRHEGLELKPVHLAEIVQFAVASAQPKAEEKGVALKVHAEEDTVVQGDRTLLESLCINLIDNAVKASERGGAVSITLEGRQVRVVDTGCGMDQETLQKIGQPFFRADKARSRKEGGAGLGVALCRSIVAEHGAELRYESAPGTGTIAFVNFYDSATT